MENNRSVLSKIKRMQEENAREKITRYSIRKYSFGAASVAVAAFLMFMGNGAVAADSLTVNEETTVENKTKSAETETPEKPTTAAVVAAEAPVAEEANKGEVVVEDKAVETAETPAVETPAEVKAEEPAKEAAAKETAKPETPAKSEIKEEKTETPKAEPATAETVAETVAPVASTNKAADNSADNAKKEQLSKYIEQVTGKMSNGAFANRSETYVKNLETALTQANATLASAQTAAEFEKAYRDLLVVANGGRVVVREDQTSGSDNRANRGVVTVNNVQPGTSGFRAVTSSSPTVNFPFGPAFNGDAKAVYVYPTEYNDVEISFSDDSGRIAAAAIYEANAATKNNLGYGLTSTEITSTTSTPASIRIQGAVDVPGRNPFVGKLVTRYVYVKDEAGNENIPFPTDAEREEGNTQITDQHKDQYNSYFIIVSAAQNTKYTAEVVKEQAAKGGYPALQNASNLTNQDLETIKSKLNAPGSPMYGKNGANGQEGGRVASVAKNGSNLVVTYNDGSSVSLPISDVVDTVRPTIEVPFDNVADKIVYLYGEEDYSFDIKVNDNSGMIGKAWIAERQTGTLYNDSNAYPVVDGKINTGYGMYITPAITTPTATDDAKLTVSGKPAPDAGKDVTTVKMTRYVVAEDMSGNKLLNDNQGNKTNGGFFRVETLAQTEKYQPVLDTGKVGLANSTAGSRATDADLDAFKAKVIGLEISDKSKGYAAISGLEHHTKKNVELAHLVTSYEEGGETKTTGDASLPQAKVSYANNGLVETENGQNGVKLLVTYPDGSTDTVFVPVTSESDIPKVDTVPFDVDDTGFVSGKQTGKIIYVYRTEVNEIPMTVVDDNQVSKIALQEAGRKESPQDNLGYGLKYTTSTSGNAGTITVTGAVDVPGKPNFTGILMTRYIEVVDNDGNKNIGSRTNTDPKETGYVQFVVRDQKEKYTEDVVKAQAAEGGRLPIADMENPTQDELNDLKARLNAADGPMGGQNADGTTGRVADIKKDGTNLVITYKDGSSITVPTKDLAQDPAIAQIEKDRAAKADAINSSNLTDEEKEKALKDMNDAAQAAKDAIEKATDDAAKQAAKEAADKAIADAPTTSAKKAEAAAAIDEAAKQRNEAIDASNLTDEEKQAEKAKVKAAADAAKANIEAATKDADVAKAQTDGTDTTSKAGTTDSAKKQEAKDAIDKAAEDKEKEIDASNLTDEEKAAAKQAVKDAATAAKTAIDAAKTDADVDSAKNNGDTAVKAPSTDSQVKKDAAKAVQDEADKRIAAIEADNSLTDEEKAAAKKDVQDKADEAKANIEKATTNDAVEKAKEAGTTATQEAGKVDAPKKQAAKDAIDKAAEDKVKEIEASNLTDEEKQAAKDKVAEEAKKAKEAIDNAKTDADVAKAQTDGDTAVKAPSTDSKVKADAKQAVQDEADKRIAEINADNSLTTEEKEAAKKDVQAKADEAKKAIEAATKDADVAKAQTDGETAAQEAGKVENPAKAAAKDAIDDAAKQRNEAIDASNLTKEEKEAEKAKVAEEAKKAKEAIDNATTDADVAAAKDAGTTATSEAGTTDSKVKEDAKAAIKEDAEKKKAAIQANDKLTEAEKTAAKNAIDAEAEKAQAAVDAATTNKDVAKAEVDGVAAAKKEAIDKASNLTDEEKVAAKQAVKDAADAAKKAIENADNTPAAIADAKKAGQDAVNATPEKSDVKQKAQDAIDTDAKAKKDAIEADNSLTTEEKEAAKKAVEAEAEKAKEAIENAKTNDEVAKAETAGKDAATEAAKVDNPKKAEAKGEIDADAKAKKEAIDANDKLTEAEKTAAKNAIDTEATKAKEAIDKATSNKDVAKAEIDGLAAAKKASIDNASNLTDEEKAAAKAKVDEEAQKAKDAIDNATGADQAETDKAIEAAKKAGAEELNKPSETSAKKAAAQKAIDDEVAAKKAAIAASNLTDEEKKAANDAIDAAAKEAKEAIEAAKTDADVDAAKNNGSDKVAEPKETSDVKKAAQDAIDADAKAKKDAIDANDKLTDDEKKAAKNAVDAEATKAKEAIENATNNKDVAKAEVDGVAAAKKAAIDNATNLTDEEKAAAKAKIDEEAAKAKEAIDNATGADQAAIDKAIADAKKAGEDAVNATEEKSDVKQKAQDAIDADAKAKKDAIDANDKLTDDEKKAAKNAVDAEATKAKEAIENATNNKDVAKAEVDGVAAAKKAAIDNATNLTDEEKAAAKAKIDEEAAKAKEAIDNATGADQAAIDKAIADAKKAGEDAVNATEEKSDVKQKAQDAIDADAKAKKDAIDANDKLTDDEKKAAKNAVDAEATKAKDAIENATNNKDVAKAEVDGIAAAKKEAIDKASNLTDEEKAAAKAKVDEDAQKAKDAIDAATGADQAAIDQAIADAKKAGEDAINATEEKSDVKQKAQDAIDADAKAKKDAIDANDKLTDEEKQAAKDAVDAEATKAKEAIENATNNKDVAKAEVDGVAAAKKEAIDKASNLTDEEKAAAKAKVDEDAQKAKDAIDAATGADQAEIDKAIEDAKKAGEDAINATEEKSDVKQKAQDAIDANAAAKKADVDAAATAKKAAIDASPNLTDAEKQAAKDAVDAEAKAAKDAIDAEATKAKDAIEKATTDKEVAKNELDGIAAAKKAAIDASNLTDEEKAAAKAKVDEEATKAKEAIDNAPNTPEAIKAAKDAGTEAVQAPSEESDKKAAAKKDVDDAAAAKKAAVDASPNLTPEEKAAAKAKIDADAASAKDKIERATTDATVDAEETAGTDEIASVATNSLKMADKVLVADPANLTADEIATIKDRLEKVNPGATVTVDENGNAVVVSPTGEKSILPVSVLTKTADDAANANGGNLVNTPASKVQVADPANLTDEDKEKARKAIQAINPEITTVTFDEKGNATAVLPDGTTAKIPASDLFKDPSAADTANGENKVNTPASKAQVADPSNLTDADKAKAEAAIKAVNPEGTKVAFNDKGDATVTLPDGTTAVIPAADLFKDPSAADTANGENKVNTPASKAQVADPSNLTDADKAKAEAAIKAVNPAGTKVAFNDKGDATVTLPDGTTAVIPAADLFKYPTAADQEDDGSQVNTPAKKAVVADPANLTDEDKAKAEEAIKAINPAGTKVAFNDKGDATVTLPDGTTAVIPAADLFKDKAAATADPTSGNTANVPAAKTLVANKEQLTEAEKAAVAEKIAAVNPGAKVVVDDKGNAKVTTPAGETVIIPAADLVKDKEDIKSDKFTDVALVPAAKTLVSDLANLTAADKAKAEEAIKALNPGVTVQFDAAGNATVVDADGNAVTIPATDLFKDATAATEDKGGNSVLTPAAKTKVADTENLTEADLAAAAEKIMAVNPGATVVFDEDGNAIVTQADGTIAGILARNLFHDEDAMDQDKNKAGHDINTPAAKTTVADLANLTEADKAKAEAEILAVNPGAKVVFDQAGNAVVTYPDGTSAAIPASSLFKDAAATDASNGGNIVNIPAAKVQLGDLDDPAERAKFEFMILGAIQDVNPEAQVSLDENGNAIVILPDGTVVIIKAADLYKTAADAETDKGGNAVATPAAKTQVSDLSNLTAADKAKAEAEILAVNPGAKVIFDSKGNATIVLPDGTTATASAKNLFKQADVAVDADAQVKTPAKKAVVADPANLTDADKENVVAAIQAVNPGAKVVFDAKGNATVTLPDGTSATIAAANLVKTATDAGNENAGNAINTPASKAQVADPANLTDADKSKAEAAILAVNPGAKVVFDKAGNALVTLADGTSAAIPAADLFKDAAAASQANAGNAVNTPASKAQVADPANLTEADKKAAEAAILAVNPGAKVIFDAKGNATVVLGDGTTATIPAADLFKDATTANQVNGGNAIAIPASKTQVADLANLTDADKAKAEATILALNPGAKVIFDAKGNATVVLGDGTTATISAADLFKDAAAASQANGGNAIATPASKALVADLANLTAADKAKAEAAILAVNPGAKVIFDAKGNATVVLGDGTTAVIPAADLFKDAAAASQANGGNAVLTPAVKTQVADLANLTADDKAKAEAAILAVNSGAKVVFDAKGNATVTLADGTSLTIAAANLFKDAAGQDNVSLPATTEVQDLNNLTEADKEAAKAAILAANPGAIVVFDAQGNAIVTLADGTTSVIAVADLFKQAQPANNDNGNKGSGIVLPGDKILVNDLSNLTEDDKARAKAWILSVYPGATVVFDAQGNAIVTLADGRVVIIPASAIFQEVQGQATTQGTNNGQTAKVLPNTGTEDSAAVTALGLLGALAGFGLVARKKKEEE